MARLIPHSTCQAFFYLCFACAAAAQQQVPTFGTTVVDSAGLQGRIYALRPGTESLPNFKRLTPIGTIYTTRLNVPTRSFTEGFPGVTGRVEWFAIDYRGKFWLNSPKTLRFALESDDGSRLYIDGKLIIDNDGSHPPSGCTGQAELSGGIHDLRVSYFQGPAYSVALMLGVADESGSWNIFDTRDFRPPSDFDPAASQHRLRKIRRGYCWARHAQAPGF